jgi:copper homeostasis protein
MILVEIAVESYEGVMAAAAGSADRIELCADLDAGGLTPSEELTRRVLSDVATPVFPMIRPRAGDFTYSAAEIGAMCRMIEMMRALGAHGLVAGALTHTNQIDLHATRDLVDAAAGLPFTFHRAFDRIANQQAALEQLIDLGVTRVLTSGGAATALAGAERLRALVRQANGRIAILAGAGIRESNVRDIVEASGVSEVHTRLISHAGEQLTAERVQHFRNCIA